MRYEPNMANLMNEIAMKLPDKWQDIGRGLGLEEHELRQIHEEHSLQQSTNQFFSSVFEKWHSGEPLVAAGTSKRNYLTRDLHYFTSEEVEEGEMRICNA